MVVEVDFVMLWATSMLHNVAKRKSVNRCIVAS